MQCNLCVCWWTTLALCNRISQSSPMIFLIALANWLRKTLKAASLVKSQIRFCHTILRPPTHGACSASNSVLTLLVTSSPDRVSPWQFRQLAAHTGFIFFTSIWRSDLENKSSMDPAANVVDVLDCVCHIYLGGIFEQLANFCRRRSSTDWCTSTKCPFQHNIIKIRWIGSSRDLATDM
jgi:hypothetical protein